MTVLDSTVQGERSERRRKTLGMTKVVKTRRYKANKEQAGTEAIGDDSDVERSLRSIEHHATIMMSMKDVIVNIP